MKIPQKFTLIFLSVAIMFKVNAQTVPMGFPFFEDALRRSQLDGKTDSNVSFMIQPVHANRALGIQNTWNSDRLLTPFDTNQRTPYTQYKNKWASVSLLPVYMHFRYNHHHPYGWNDGAMIPSKGRQLYMSGGAYADMHYGIVALEAQWRPEWVEAQNLPFQNPPFRSRNIDFPERMGQDPYGRSFRGQSYVHLHVGPLTAGYGYENVTWGAGRKNNIILSNNAPGFGHFTFHTNKPIKIKPLGTIEFQVIGGKLRPSGFTYPNRYTGGEWPPIAGDVVVDTNALEYYSFFTGMKGVYQPKWFPGLFLGASRIVQLAGEPSRNRDYFDYLYLGAKGEQTGSGSGAVNRNQLIALSFRYSVPRGKLEFYGEFGREDWAWDFEDFMTRPQASTAWMLGVRKLQDQSDGSQLEIMAEVTHIQAPFANYAGGSSFGGSGVYSFYMAGEGGSMKKGWTHHGQVLGAGIGPGSNMATIGIKQIKGYSTTSLAFERVAYNQDLFYSAIDYLQLNPANPLSRDHSKHFIDWGFLLQFHRAYGKMLVGYNFHLLRTYNFNWNYDPNGVPGDFRFPGINVWSLNAEVSAVYLF